MTPLWEEAAGQRERLLAWARRMTSDAGVAEEAVQDTLLKAWLKGASLREPSARWSWLYTVLRNSVRMNLRRRGCGGQRVLTLGDRDGGVEDVPAVPCSRHSPRLVAVVKGLVSLHPSYQAILKSVHVEGVPVAEFAMRHGITRNNAKVRLYRARCALRRRVQTTGGPEKAP